MIYTNNVFTTVLKHKIGILLHVPFSLWLSFSMDCSSLCSSREREVGAVQRKYKCQVSIKKDAKAKYRYMLLLPSVHFGLKWQFCTSHSPVYILHKYCSNFCTSSSQVYILCRIEHLLHISLTGVHFVPYRALFAHQTLRRTFCAV